MNKGPGIFIHVRLAACALCLLLRVGCASSMMRASLTQGENKSQAESLNHPATKQNSSGPTTAYPDEQRERLDLILKAVDHIRLLAASHRGRPLDEKMRDKIDKELEQIKNPRDISNLALICRAIGDYEHDFYIAFEDCVEQLAEDTSETAVDELNFLMQRVHPESGDKQLFDEAIAHQQEKRRRKKKE